MDPISKALTVSQRCVLVLARLRRKVADSQERNRLDADIEKQMTFQRALSQGAATPEDQPISTFAPMASTPVGRARVATLLHAKKDFEASRDALKSVIESLTNPSRRKQRKKARKLSPAEFRRATKGRRDVSKGKRPAIKDAIRLIMGNSIMSPDEVMEGLKKPSVEARQAFKKMNPAADMKGDWVPNANNPRTYVGYILCSEKKYFEVVKEKGRGFYRVRTTSSQKHHQPIAPLSTPRTLREKLLSLVDQQPRSAERLGLLTKTEPAKVREVLSTLLSEGVVERVAQNKRSYWIKKPEAQSANGSQKTPEDILKEVGILDIRHNTLSGE